MRSLPVFDRHAGFCAADTVGPSHCDGASEEPAPIVLLLPLPLLPPRSDTTPRPDPTTLE